jgi:hypothetical protein
MSKEKYVATDIYERLEVDKDKTTTGSVQDDLAQFDNMEDMLDYFGDLDPCAFL